jgi:hypothetical protein
MTWGRMEEAPEYGKESSHSAHANGMNERILWHLFYIFSSSVSIEAKDNRSSIFS